MLSQHLRQSAAATGPLEFPTNKVASQIRLHSDFLIEVKMYVLCYEQPVCLRVSATPDSIHMHVGLCVIKAHLFYGSPLVYL